MDDEDEDRTDTGSVARNALREATKAVHLRLHRHPLLQPLLGATVTREAYRAALVGLYGFHAAIEPVLADGSARSALIRRDLAVLGYTPERLAALPVADNVPPVTSEAARLACRYVMSGSYLGGRRIGEHLRRALGVGPTTGAAFFCSAGIDVDRVWSSLAGDLEAHLTTPERLAEACTAGVAAFEALERWIDRQPLPTKSGVS